MGMEAGGVISRYLSKAEVEAFGAELEAIRKRVRADLGEKDVAYIKRIMRLQRRLEKGGRLALQFNFFNPLIWAGGVAALTVSKVLHTLEMGHNMMHNQYDWTNDPELMGKNFEWYFLSPGAHWRHHHNIYHHKYTNIIGKDRDIGYGVLRMAEEQPWHPARLVTQPLIVVAHIFAFEWMLAMYDLEVEKIVDGRWRWQDHREQVMQVLRKMAKMKSREYLINPLLAGPFFLPVIAGQFTVNVLTSLWWFALIYCGHFPDGVHMFTQEECENETRAEWYVRQILGSCNIEGDTLFHVLSGHVSCQIEHHLFPTLPGHRCAEVAPEVRALCEKYGLPYNTGSLAKQLGGTLKRIARCALPNGFFSRKPDGRKAEREPAYRRLAASVSEKLPQPLRQRIRQPSAAHVESPVAA